MLFSILGPISLPVVAAQPDEGHQQNSFFVDRAYNISFKQTRSLHPPLSVICLCKVKIHCKEISKFWLNITIVCQQLLCDAVSVCMDLETISGKVVYIKYIKFVMLLKHSF